jgi:6-phosphogluconolactonase (cycloisomerase 2 family)
MRVGESKPICTEAAIHQETRPSARIAWRFAALLCLLALLCPLALNAQNFAYVNNQSGVSNSITAFSVDTGGVATSIGTVSTGGTGATVACAGIDRITVNLASNLLFVSNGGDQSISVFRITPATGVLAAVAGSPFASGLTLDSCAGISLATTPDGHFLMASSNGQIKTFSVAPTGALTLSSTASLLPAPMVGMKISGDGRFLAVSHQSSVSVFTISGVDGSLTAVAGSPFAKGGTGLVGGLDFNCDGTLLYAAEGGSTSSLTDAWSVAASGALTPIAGSPFTAAGNDSNVVFLTPDNTILYQSNQGSNDLNSFTVNADGTLTSIGVFNIAAAHSPVGLASDNSGLFLYGADNGFGLAVFNILPGVVPTLVGDTALAGASQIQGVAAYPPRSCAHTDFSVTQTATPNPVTAGNQLTYNITVTNNGPSTASVAINDLLPRNFVTFVSCTPGPGGVCDKGAGLNRTITFASLASGQSGTATIVASTVSTLLNGDTISNTSLVSNSSAVDTNSANNSASTSVTVSAPLSATNFIVANSTGNYFGTTSLSTTLKRTLNGAAVAGRTITFSLDGTVVGSALTNASGVASLPNVSLVLGGIPITAGSHAIGVNFAGDSQYQTSSGTSTLTVNKAVLTVTAQNAAKIYGDANPAFTYVITGFLNNETVAVVSGTANCTSSANVGTSAGTAPISCAVGTLSATNYSFTFVPAILTINRAPLVLAGNSVSRLYGDPNPALTGTVTGLKAGDQATATFSTTALSTSPVGAYPITGTVVPGASFLAANYTVTSTGTLTVNPAPLTASAANASRLYGDPNPTFTGTIAGAKNGDVFTATFASAADPSSPVGTYPITATLSGAPSVISNYTVTSNGGTLTVNPAALSVTAANASRLYGDPNPLFTGAITGIKNADNITATYASAAVAASPVGTSPIVPTLLDPAVKLGNYTVTSNNGTLTVNPAPLSVTAANSSRLYGDANPLFSGTITGIKNNDAITATYASVADPTSSVGTFPIVPTLVDPAAKLGNYSVLSGSGTLTVNTAPLSVAGANASRLYGDANPVLSGTITGIKNSDNITATFASTATAASPVGGYPITPSLVDPSAKLGNYSVTSSNGTLTVSPASLIVTGTNASRLYGDANPAFTGTIVGIKNADNITATFTSAATAASAVGGYPITPSLVDPTAKLSNYSVTSNNGTLTVNPAALTVAAADATRAYGDPNPAFTGSIAGLKNGDIITATFASTATTGSAVGAYPITPSPVDPGNKLGNYIVTSNNGTLTITTVSLTVNAGNASRAYGDPNPAFTGTIIGLKNGDAITATYTSIAGATSPVGIYPVSPTLVDPTSRLGNYTVTSNNGTLTVNPAVLTFTALNTSRLYGDPNPVFVASVAGLKNGDPITATLASAATAASPVGPYAIVLSLLDPNGKLVNYTASTINGVLTVNPAPLNVSGGSASRVYGDPNPAFTGSVTGQKNGDVITATFASLATPASPVGSYPVVATLADPGTKLGNYTINSNNGILTVTPAALTVSAGIASRLYGDPNPAFAGAITGLKNGDNITGTYAAADPTLAVGTYPLVPSLVDPGGKLGNYAVTSNNGTINIGPAALSVIAANAARAYGSPNPAFTGVIAGLKNADNITVTFATVADINSILGIYPIVPTVNDPSLKLGNYTVTSKNGTLIIGPATPAVVLTVQPGLSTALLTVQVLNAGAIFPTGTVQFSEGTTALGQPVTLAQLPPGTPPTASLQVPLTAGTHIINANYSGDPTYTASAASPVTVVIAGPPPGLRFVPVAPCRIADTRNPVGPFGGPFITGGTSRGFTVPDSACNIPATAQAYSVNVTVVPKGPLGFLTMFPCGQSVPLASTLNSIDGRVKAAAAIIPAGTNGGVCAFATQNTELIVDINGYFVSDLSPSVLEFYPLAPCRLVDTRNAAGSLGGPSLVGAASRTFPILSSPCNIPATAKAYSLNFTSVPKGPLGFLTTWPAGSSQPLVSTLNAITGAVTANAAIVPAGTNGDISVFVTQASDLVIDINGYFAPPDTGGLSFFPLAPCRVLDTRNPAGALPFNGKVDANVSSSGCAAPASAQSFVLNATVVPPGPLGFLTLWPQGATQPLVSTLNAIDGSITSNMAIVPTTNGSVSAFSSNPAHLILDISGYFAP